MDRPMDRRTDRWTKGRTDRWTNRPTDGRTRPIRDAWSHLKMQNDSKMITNLPFFVQEPYIFRYLKEKEFSPYMSFVFLSHCQCGGCLNLSVCQFVHQAWNSSKWWKEQRQISSIRCVLAIWPRTCLYYVNVKKNAFSYFVFWRPCCSWKKNK